MAKIYDIEFSCPHDEFMQGFSNYLSNWGNSNIDCSSTEQGTKNGKYMYKIEVNNKDVSSKTTLLFEKNANNSDIMFVPTGFQSFGGTFYKHESTEQNLDSDDDTLYASICYLEELAKQKKGMFAATTEHKTICVVNGNSKGAKDCLVDSNGNVYGAKDVKNVYLGASIGNISVQFNTPIGQWIKQKKLDDPMFDQQMSNTSLSTSDKMNFIGKYLITARSNDEIDSEEFKDIFHQAGLLGFTDQAVLNIYKLIV